MKKKESLSRKLTFGVFYLLSSSIANLGISVITVGFIARALDVENFGLYSAILSFVGLFQFLSDFGLNKTLLKFGSTYRAKAQVSFGNALFLKSILSVPTLILIALFGYFAGYRNEEFIILILFGIGLILDSYATVFSSIRRILGSFKLISFFRIVKGIINLIIIFAALNIQNSVLSLAWAVMLLSLIVFILSLINTVMLLKPKLNLALIKEYSKDSVLFSFNDFFLNIYGKISTVLLSFFYEFQIVGIYSAAVRFTKIANLLPAQVKLVLLPTMYRLLDTERKDDKKSDGSKRVFIILLKYMALFATPVAISIYFFSDSIIHLIFGEKYNLSIPLVKLFSFFIYLRFIETPFTLFYIGLHKHKKMVWFQGATSLLNLILNLILIPKFSVYGACFATLISETLMALLLIFSGIKYLIWHLNDVLKMVLKPAFAGFVGLILVTTIFSKSNIFIQEGILLLCYSLLLFVIKVFDKSDKELFVKIFIKKEVMLS